MQREPDFDKFAKAMYALGQVFNRDMTEALIELYFNALSDLTIEQFERAAYLAINECKFFPKPVELRETLAGTPSDQAAAAWECVMHAKAEAGMFRSVLFKDGAIGAALCSVFGGWVELCEMTHQVWGTSEVSWEEREEARTHRRVAEGRRILISGLSNEMLRAKQKEFEAAYRNAKREGRARAYLQGHHEIENINTISTWTRGQLPEYQPILIADGTDSYFVNGRFDTSTARLITTVLELLNAAPVESKALPPVERKVLPAATVTPEEAEAGRREWDEAIKELTEQRRMPKGKPMTAGETAERVRELRQQAELLEEEEHEPIPF